MRMRTIRWCNGQCPGRNGQWAERIAHAGSGAVRLVPFSAAAVFPRILRSPALLALRVLLPLLLIQLDRFHHGLSGMAELRDVSVSLSSTLFSQASLGSFSRRQNNASVGFLEVHEPDPEHERTSKTRSSSRRAGSWIRSRIGEQRARN